MGRYKKWNSKTMRMEWVDDNTDSEGNATNYIRNSKGEVSVAQTPFTKSYKKYDSSTGRMVWVDDNGNFESNQREYTAYANKLKKQQEEMQKQQKQQEDEGFFSGWLKKGKGNIITNTLATGWDILRETGKGIIGTGETIFVDLPSTVIGLGTKVFNKDAGNKILNFARMNLFEEYEKAVGGDGQDIVDRYSYLGEKSDAVVNTIGSIYAAGGLSSLATKGTSTVVGSKLAAAKASGDAVQIAKYTQQAKKAVSVARWSPIFTQGAVNGALEADKDGANPFQTLSYGLLSGATEVFTEQMFSMVGSGVGKKLGIGGIKGITGQTGADEFFALALTNNKFMSTKPILRNVLQSTAMAMGEGFEEFASGFITSTGKTMLGLFGDNDFRQSWGTNIKDADLGNSFLMGAVTAGVMGLPAAIYTGATTGEAVVSKATPEEYEATNKKISEQISELDSDNMTKRDYRKAKREITRNAFLEMENYAQQLIQDRGRSYYKDLSDKLSTIKTETNAIINKPDVTIEELQNYGEQIANLCINKDPDHKLFGTDTGRSTEFMAIGRQLVDENWFPIADKIQELTNKMSTKDAGKLVEDTQRKITELKQTPEDNRNEIIVQQEILDNAIQKADEGSAIPTHQNADKVKRNQDLSFVKADKYIQMLNNRLVEQGVIKPGESEIKLSDITENGLKVWEKDAVDFCKALGIQLVYVDSDVDFKGMTIPAGNDSDVPIMFFNRNKQTHSSATKYEIKVTENGETKTYKANVQEELIYTLGHEIYHSMVDSNPKLAENIFEFVKNNATDEDIVDFVTRRYGRDTEYVEKMLEPKNRNVVIEEMSAEAVAKLAINKEFLTDLMEKKPEVAKQLEKFANNVIRKTTNSAFDNPLTEYGLNTIKKIFETTLNNAKEDVAKLTEKQSKKVFETQKTAEQITKTKKSFIEGTEEHNEVLKVREERKQQRQKEQELADQQYEWMMKNMPPSEDVEEPTNKKSSVSDNQGYHYGDLGKGIDTNYFAMTSSRRSTGHFGTGTYFVGDSTKVSDRFKKGKPEHKINFDGYNLYKVRNNNDGWILHDGLEAINNQEFGNSDLTQLARLLERTYQIGEEQFNNTIEKTMNYILKTENADWEHKLKMDSPSTYFMKQLGFEGVDTRNVEQFDNSAYGSVIYDLKTNDNMTTIKKPKKETTLPKKKTSELTLSERAVKEADPVGTFTTELLKSRNLDFDTVENIKDEIINAIGNVPDTTIDLMNDVADDYFDKSLDFNKEYGITKKKTENTVFTNDEQYAINKWSGINSYYINDYLRNNITIPEDVNGVPLRKVSDDLMNALNKIKPHKGIVYRSIPLKGEALDNFLKKYKVGEIVTEAPFTSASVGQIYDDSWNVQLEINSKTAKDTTELFRADEREVLFNRNSKFKVLEVNDADKNNIKIKLEDVSNKKEKVEKIKKPKESKKLPSKQTTKTYTVPLDVMRNSLMERFSRIDDNGNITMQDHENRRKITLDKQQSKEYTKSLITSYENYIKNGGDSIPKLDAFVEKSRGAVALDTLKTNSEIEETQKQVATVNKDKDLMSMLKERGAKNKVQKITEQDMIGLNEFKSSNLTGEALDTAMDNVINSDYSTILKKLYYNEYKNKGGNQIFPELEDKVTVNPNGDIRLMIGDGTTNTDTLIQQEELNPLAYSMKDFVEFNKGLDKLISQYESERVTTQDNLNKAKDLLYNHQDELFNQIINAAKDNMFTNLNSEAITATKILGQRAMEMGDLELAKLCAKAIPDSVSDSARTLAFQRWVKQVGDPEWVRDYIGNTIKSEYTKKLELNPNDATLRQWIQEKFSSNGSVNVSDTDMALINMIVSANQTIQNDYTGKYSDKEKLIQDKIADSMIAGIIEHDAPGNNWKQRALAFRRLSMLSGTKTQLRNILSNFAQFGIDKLSELPTVLGDYVATSLITSKHMTKEMIDKLTYTGEATDMRTYVKLNAKEKTVASRLAARDAEVTNYLNSTLGINIYDTQNEGKEIKFNSKFLNEYKDTLGMIMEGPDTSAFTYYLANETMRMQKIKAQNNLGVTNPTIEQIQSVKLTKAQSERAIEIAKEQTFKSTKSMAYKMSKSLIDGLNTFSNSIIKDSNLGSFVQPFLLTPANVGQMVLEMSPVGFAIALNDGRKLVNMMNNPSQYTASEIMMTKRSFARTFGRVIAGTIIAAVGAGLAQGGVLTGGEPEDEDKADLLKIQGWQPYSIKIGNKYVSFDWLAPSSASLSMGVDFTSEQGVEWSSVIGNILESSGERFSENSVMESMKELFGGGYNDDSLVKRISKVFASVPASFIPTISKEIADTIDPTTKQVYDDNYIKYALYQAVSKIPFAKSTLTTKSDRLGGDVGKSRFNILVPAGNMTAASENADIGQHLLELANATGDYNVLPPKVQKTLTYTVNNVPKKVSFTRSQQQLLTKEAGTIYTNTLNELLGTDTYLNATTDDKLKMIDILREYAKNKAVVDSGYAPDYESSNNNYKAIKNYTDAGLSLENSILYKTYVTSIKGDKDSNGETIKGSQLAKRAYEVMNYSTTNAQKNIMLKLLQENSNEPETVNELQNLVGLEEYKNYFKLNKNDLFISEKFSRKDYQTGLKLGISGAQFTDYYNAVDNIQPDYINGKQVSGSKKKKVLQYLNSTDLNIGQKIYLLNQSGYSIKEYKTLMTQYLNSLNTLDADEKLALYEEMFPLS